MPCKRNAQDGTPHPSNTRAKLREIMDDKVKATQPWFGLEQEYTMLSKKTGRIFGWPDNGYPAPQGPFYCGVGAESVFGRPLAEAHMVRAQMHRVRMDGGAFLAVGLAILSAWRGRQATAAVA